jgi:uncharacterized membrane protein YhaH (DUF805 family)
MSWFLRRGRLRAKTYWLVYILPICAVTFTATRLDVLLFDADGNGAPADASLGEEFAAGPAIFVASALCVVPLISSTAARLHDTGRSAWWLLTATIPVAGPFVIIYLCAQAGQRFSNEYGPGIGQVAAPTAPSAPPSGGYAQYPGL